MGSYTRFMCGPPNNKNKKLIPIFICQIGIKQRDEFLARIGDFKVLKRGSQLRNPAVLIGLFWLSFVAVVSLGGSAISYAGQKIEIQSEVNRIEENLKLPHFTLEAQQKYRKYLDVLSCVLASPSGEGVRKHSDQISVNLVKRIKSSAYYMDSWFKAPVSAQEICNFFNFMEKYKDVLKSSAQEFFTYQFGLEDGRSRDVGIFVSQDPEPRLFLDLGFPPLREGASKAYSVGIDYKTWELVAELRYKPGDVSSLVFEHEVSLMKKVSSFSDLKKNEGVVDLLGHTSNVVFQKYYDGDLMDFYAKNQGTEIQKLEILQQLASVLMVFHKQGIAHNDIKLENVLVKVRKDLKLDEPGKYCAVLTDFGCSDHPRQSIQLGYHRPLVGSLYTMAPEVGFNWIGADLEAKVSNAFKSDIYSLGVVAGVLFDPGFNVEVHYCSDLKDLVEIKGCMQEVTQRYVSDWQKPGSQFILRDLLKKALEVSPESRVSAEEFHQEVTRVLEELSLKSASRSASLAPVTP
ncbi:MAG: protein kinase domain-containing protein [Bdellovibrionia bacterium]